MENNSAPKIVAGKDRNRAGKIFVDMTGGTEGPEKMFQAFVNAGIGTVVCMHLSEKHIQEASKNNINVIIAGHIASDNLGINLLLDEVLKGEKVNIIPCSGFFRVER
jgi:putative NIF3 family GTP cyclohydrolase 1 type 2